VLSFTDVIVMSSNIGAIKVGLRLGQQRLGIYARRFGFGRPSSPDFPGESPGILWDPAKQNEGALASMSMGYQVGVTPLQMAAAVSSVANGGELIEPRVVRAVIKDGRRVPVPRKVVRRAIDPGVAAELTAIMEQVVERGTATMVKMPGYNIAGKTGTAARLVAGRYSKSDYNASFIGFVPSRKPVFTIVVVLDSPHGPNGYFGGPVSGPIFKRIAAAAMRQYGVPPSINPAPPLMVARHDGEDSHEQPTSTAGSTPSLVTLGGASRGSEPVFPDLRGLSARDALRTLTRLGMTGRLNGAGTVTRQQPEPGTPIDRDASCILWLERQTPVHLAGGSAALNAGVSP
jgi:membrane peptidoglycan carboxypeptidase